MALYKKIFIVFLFLGSFFIYFEKAFATDFYFCSDGDFWENPSNWYLDDVCSIPAGALPTDITDTAIIPTGMEVYANEPITTLANIESYGQLYITPIETSGTINFRGDVGSNGGSILASEINFYNNSSNGGPLSSSGTINFYASSTNNASGGNNISAAGGINFYDDSYNNQAGGSLNSDVTFHDNSYCMDSSLQEYAKFYDNSYTSCLVVKAGYLSLYGDTTENSYDYSGIGYSTVLNRIYLNNATTTRSFTGAGDFTWGVLADGAVVNIASSTLGNASFSTANSGRFIYSAPFISLNSVTSIGSTSAVLNATITDDRGASSTLRGFNFGTTLSYGTTTSDSGVFGNGAFSKTLSSLTCSTTYNYRAFTQNIVGVSTTSNSTFSTLACAAEPAPEPDPEPISTPSTISGSRSNRNSKIPVPNPVIKNVYPIVDFNTQKNIVPSDTFKRNLTLNFSGDDVKYLQKYLNSMGFTVSNSGPGSMGNETTFFGPLTRNALIRFQLENGIFPALGFFGPITRAYIGN